MFRCAFCILLQKEGINYVSNVLVFQKLPDSVTRQYYYLVLWRQSELFNLWHRVDSNSTRHCIAEGPRHCKARYVFIF